MMKTLKYISLGLLLISFISGFSQQMEQGFNYLETGQFAKAEMFFTSVLKDYPNNKTARLCYGRAIGLNGKSEAAKTIFEDLLTDYPNDVEVKLNYGESLLWNKNFTDAKAYYTSLVDENPTNFAALLSFANTLSNLQNYEEALIYVNKALEVSPGNPNALISKKYMYLGYAYQHQQLQQYDTAEALLLEALELFKNDKDALKNLANLYIIWNKLDQAKNTYQQLEKQPEQQLTALNGLALVSHLNGKEKHALVLSTKAYQQLTVNTAETLKQQTTERYIQALIWNKNYKNAETLIETLMEDYPNQNWVLALRATLNIYKSNFKQSLSDYNQILSNDSTSFDGNLGKANVLKALGRVDEALTSANNTLKFYTNQKDAVNFIEQVKLSVSPTVETKAAHSFDNGDNKAYSFNTNITFPLNSRFSVLGNYNYRNTKNSVTQNTANSNSLSLGAAYVLWPNITLKGLAGLTSAKAENNNFTQLLANVSLNIKALKLQSLEVGYNRQIESFNAELLNRELVQNNYFVNYNLSTNINLGWFTQYMYTSQSDGNTRNLLFTSLYYNLLAKPSLKVGVNYQYITFKDQLPTIYFSPEKFNAGEVFVNLIKDEAITKPKEWFYNATAAFGYQFIEDADKQSTYRLQAALGYKFSKRSLLNLYGTHSNIASATAAGFTFTEIGLRFRWVL